MLKTLMNLLGFGPSVDYASLIESGATIVDVRTKSEYKSGSVKGSVNIPLQELNERISKLKKDKPVITCCASGARSASAKRILESHGFSDVHNAGSWYNLSRYEK